LICPNCLEEYKFIKFELHPESPEPRAIFSCECDRPTILRVRDSLNLEMLQEEQKDQLRIFKLMALRSALDRERRPLPLPSQALPVRVRNLERYLSEISLKEFGPAKLARTSGISPPTKK